MRLFDIIALTNPKTYGFIADHTVICADNVARHYFVESPQDNYDWRDFCILPTFDKMWVEYRAPTLLNVRGEISKHPHNRERWVGASVTSYRFKAPHVGIFDKTGRVLPRLLQQGVFWTFDTIMFVYDGRVNVLECSVGYRTFTNNAGSLLAFVGKDGWSISLPIAAMQQNISLSHPLIEAQIRALAHAFAVVNYTLTFLQCHNIEIVDNVPPKALVKKHQKHHRTERTLTTYKTVQIDPNRTKTLYNRPYTPNEERAMRRGHIRAGHFRNYKRGKGLFGKHKIVVWIPQSFVGSTGNGTVEKEYDVLPKRETED